MSSVSLAPSPGFQEDLAATVLLLRGALTDLLASVSADPTTPQVMSRQLGLDKTLAWKVARLVTGADPVESLEHLPGASGLRILLKAATAAGAPAETVARVRLARAAFDRLVEVHSGDRATLDAMLAGLESAGQQQRKRAEAARRQSFLGNSATWGVQARVRVGLHVMAPNDADPSRVDLLNVGALHDLRRLRTDIRWPLVIQKSFGMGLQPGSSDDAMGRVGEEGAPLLTEFCSTPLPTLQPVAVPNGTAWELCPGPVGLTASMTATFGFLSRAVAPVAAAKSGEYGEHFTMLNIPAEHLLVDLLVHRSLPFAMPPEALLVSHMQSDAPLAAADRRRYEIPLHESVAPIGSVVSTPLLPRYPELVAMAVDRIGLQLSDFQGFRLVMRYPPIPAVAVLRHRLPTSGE
ncbi:MAG: hypothetical protein ACI9EF_003263 [Pseudohongiellaceae bacterium]|jgi:hypothetical protein